MPPGEDDGLLGDGADPIPEARVANGSCDVAAVHKAAPHRTVYKESVIIEYCCDPENMMGQKKGSARLCESLRKSTTN